MDYQAVFNILESSSYHSIKEDIYSLINDGEFIKKIIRVNNPFIFDRFIKMCEYKIDTTIIHERRNDYLKDKIIKLTNDNISEYYGINDI